MHELGQVIFLLETYGLGQLTHLLVVKLICDKFAITVEVRDGVP